ncbi:DoxX-like family protein [Meridianimaribacter flavus]|uniref:DoxX-like protein n=1 Tax=Meridianimaribacter flavus TaxID=571115 RepID=A0ABY2G4B8_9FLAO|nr:DoxX-like family protein [Meridianimaribacter flavus]TDY11648.1 DoxX-like protein [Meridianimaribacter flavus]
MYKIINIALAGIWFINGLFCKVLNLVPRHEQIVANILSGDYSRPLILTIGCLEIAMAFWILSNKYSKLNAVVQIVIIASMNILEFVITPELLLWGKLNAFFACILIIIIYYNQFHFNKTHHELIKS